MRRLSSIAVVAAVAAAIPSLSGAQSPSSLISVGAADDHVSFHLTSEVSQEIVFQEAPARLIVDFKNARLEAPARVIEVGGRNLSRIRLGKVGDGPVPMARVILEMPAEAPYRAEWVGGTMILWLGAAAMEAPAAPQPLPPPSLAQKPAPKPAAPVKATAVAASPASVPSVAPTPAAAPKAPAPAPAAPKPAAPAAPKAPAPAPAAPKAAAPAPAAPKAAAPVPAAPKPAAPKAPAAAPKAPTPAPAASSPSVKVLAPRFWVQLGSFGEESRAEAMKEKIGKVDYPILVAHTPVDGKTFYQVRAGPFETQTLADAAAKKLAEGGWKGLVLKR